MASLALEQTQREMEAALVDCKKTWTLELHHMKLEVEVIIRQKEALERSQRRLHSSKSLRQVAELLTFEPLICRNLKPKSRLRAVLDNCYAEDTMMSDESEQSKVDCASGSKDEVTTERREIEGKSLELQLLNIQHRIGRYVDSQAIEDTLQAEFSKDPPISMARKLGESGNGSMQESSSQEEIYSEVASDVQEPENKSPPVHQQSLFSFCSPDEKLPSVQSLCTSSEDDIRPDPLPAFLSSNQSVSSFTLGRSKQAEMRSTLKVAGRVKTQVTPMKEQFKGEPSMEEVSMDALQWVPDRHKLSVETIHEADLASAKQPKRSLLRLLCPCLGGTPAVRHK